MGTADYINRTIDLMAFQGVQTDEEVLLEQSLASPGESGTIATGIQKLGQRFLQELLTSKGSITYMPSRGCDFIQEMMSGEIRSHIDLQGALTRALLDVENNLVGEETAADPADEQYAGAEIEQTSITNDNAMVKIRVISEAGDSRSVIVPIPLTT